MTWSDWIALLAAVAACLALIPAYLPLLKSKNRISWGRKAVKPTKEGPSEPVKLNDFGKALVLTSYGLAIGVIELVMFSAIAGLNGVSVDVSTMPTNWLVAFYGIFVLPGIFLFWAAAHLFNLWE